MIYEKNSNIIVMLAEEEDEKETFINCSIKAHRYWPKIGKEEKYGDFLVVNENEYIYNDLYINEFILINTTNDKKRKIYFFKYIGWPDMGVPENIKAIKRILNKMDRIYEKIKQEYMNEKIQHTIGPVVVHCSAGLGRTGTFICLQIVKDQLDQFLIENINNLDSKNFNFEIFNVVKQLKNNRNGMIQRKEQYVYCYEFLKEYSIEKGLGNLFNKTEKINKDLFKKDSEKKDIEFKKDFDIKKEQNVYLKKDNSDIFDDMKNE